MLTSSKSFSGFHALILEGVAADGGREDALREAAAHFCGAPREKTPCLSCPQCRKVMGGVHPDVSVLDLGPGKEITVDKVRAIRADAFIRPFESQCKVYAVLRAENLNVPAQNAFLKLLEEPPSYAVFLLHTSSAVSLLPTVRSRCVTVKILGETWDESPDAAGRGKALSAAFQKSDELALAKVLWSWDKLPRMEIAAAIKAFCFEVRGCLAIPAPKAAKAIKDAMEILDAIDGNAAVGICCAALCTRLASI